MMACLALVSPTHAHTHRAIMKRRSQRFPPEMAPRLSSDAILEKWRNEPTTQEQLRQNVLAVLTDIFDRGEEVPVVVRACVLACLLTG